MAAQVGLKLSAGMGCKCEAVPLQADLDLSAFPGDFKANRDGNFEFLGMPIGSKEFREAHTLTRTRDAKRLLNAIGELPDPQVALKLLRTCGSFCRLVYSARNISPGVHRSALQSFDDAVRECFAEFSGLRPEEDSWTQASLPTTMAGLGLRSVLKHSCATFLASRSQCFKLCRQLDPAHTLESPNDSGPSAERLALRDFNASVLHDRTPPVHVDGPQSQRELSKAIDERSLSDLADPSRASPARRAHLSLLQSSGAGLFWHAQPSRSLHLDVPSDLFTVVLLRWLRMPISQADSFCPLCEGGLDRYGDHCLSCCGGGDRTRRHNLVRNLVYFAFKAAGLDPELERLGLLPPRPLAGGSHEDGTHADCNGDSSARRPADVYVPRWRAGPPAALDFAVTSGLNPDALAQSERDSYSACTRYEDRKRSFKDTAALCQQQGFSFIPMVVEAVGGGWGREARKVWSELAKVSASAAGELATASTCGVSLQQRLSTVLHRENARAVLRRLGHGGALPEREHLSMSATLAEEAHGV